MTKYNIVSKYNFHLVFKSENDRYKLKHFFRKLLSRIFWWFFDFNFCCWHSSCWRNYFVLFHWGNIVGRSILKQCRKIRRRVDPLNQKMFTSCHCWYWNLAWSILRGSILWSRARRRSGSFFYLPILLRKPEKQL